MGHLLEVRRCFFLLNELLPINVLTCTKVLKEAQWGVRERDDFGRGRNVADADACSVASL
jgi:hypothetical protein